MSMQAAIWAQRMRSSVSVVLGRASCCRWAVWVEGVVLAQRGTAGDFLQLSCISCFWISLGPIVVPPAVAACIAVVPARLVDYLLFSFQLRLIHLQLLCLLLPVLMSVAVGCAAPARYMQPSSRLENSLLESVHHSDVLHDHQHDACAWPCL
jgi:hypothetical protein